MILVKLVVYLSLLAQDGEDSASSAGNPGSILGSRRSPWRREWLPSPVFLLKEFHGQRAWWAAVHGVTKSWLVIAEQLTLSLSE